jgi:hypothetical protein
MKLINSFMQLDPVGAPEASEFLRKDGEEAWEYARRIFDLVFNRDINRVVGIDVLWETRKPPSPLPLAGEMLGEMHAPTSCWGADDLLKYLKLNPREVHLRLMFSKVYNLSSSTRTYVSRMLSGSQCSRNATSVQQRSRANTFWLGRILPIVAPRCNTCAYCRNGTS